MILLSEVLKDTSCPRTLSLTEVMTLTRDDLGTVCKKHLELNIYLRRAQIKLALWRGFIYFADRIRRNRGTGLLDWFDVVSHTDAHQRGSVGAAERGSLRRASLARKRR